MERSDLCSRCGRPWLGIAPHDRVIQPYAVPADRPDLHAANAYGRFHQACLADSPWGREWAEIERAREGQHAFAQASHGRWWVGLERPDWWRAGTALSEDGRRLELVPQQLDAIVSGDALVFEEEYSLRGDPTVVLGLQREIRRRGSVPLTDAIRRLGYEEGIVEPDLFADAVAVPDPDADPCADALICRVRLRWRPPADLVRAARDAAALRRS